MATIKIYDSDHNVIAEFNTYSDKGYYACATKHGSTMECLYELGWPLQKNYLKFFEEAYSDRVSNDFDCAWPATCLKDKFDRAVFKLLELPKVASIRYNGVEYDSKGILTTSECIKQNDKVKFIFDDETLTYSVEATYLYNGGQNDRLFEELKITDEVKFMEDIYGYKVTGGIWPEFNDHDYSWWPKFAAEMEKRDVRIYINGTPYKVPVGTKEIDKTIDKIDSSARQLLQRGSIVKIVVDKKIYEYTCKRVFLLYDGAHNNQVFQDAGIDGYEFCEICYGYRPQSSPLSKDAWPETYKDDYDALYRALCGIAYTIGSTVEVDGACITKTNALEALTVLQLTRLSELMHRSQAKKSDESPIKSDASQNHTNIKISHEIKLTNISCKNKVKL